MEKQKENRDKSIAGRFEVLPINELNPMKKTGENDQHQDINGGQDQDEPALNMGFPIITKE